MFFWRFADTKAIKQTIFCWKTLLYEKQNNKTNSWFEYSDPDYLLRNFLEKN